MDGERRIGKQKYKKGKKGLAETGADNDNNMADLPRPLVVALRVGSLKATVTARAAPGERVRGWSCQYPRGVRVPVESQAREGGGVIVCFA